MARKKRGKRTVRKKASVKNKIMEGPIDAVRTTDKKIKFIIKNLIVFVILTVISYVAYRLFEDVYKNFFGFVYSVLGIISVALLLVLLIFIFLKLLKKRK